MRLLPPTLRLPGRCVVCRQPVVFTGKRWQDPGRQVAHACPAERAVCGALMRYAREPCARRPGHGYEHRTAYAMENARRHRGGVAA